MKTFTKQPSERLDFDFDYTEWLAARGNDSITDANVVSEPGITVDSSIIIDGNYVKVFTSGGTNGTKYKLTCLAETLGGRIAELEMVIHVKEL